jgi:membrane peptidoglycan carboxypeptidase
MFAGGAMVWLSYYVEDVNPPAELALDQASRVFYSDGEEIAVLQEENREIIDTTGLTVVQEAVVSAEDKKFWEHSGVDFLGIARAAWNNLTGGEIQGASTITQQYARIAGNLHGRTYARKLEEAAMAYKLGQEYQREQILDFYLNTVYFGRGAYGIQAAARAYFGVEAAELDVAQAAMLAGIIRYPDDGSGLSAYDPLNNPEDASAAENRWSWVLSQMQETGASSLQGVNPAELELPEVIEPSSMESWHEGPQGPIVRQVQEELEEMGITDVSTGGYRVTTTIDPEMQEAAERAAWREHKDANLWEGYPEDIAAAMVAIDPTTGAVRAYFGGDDGTAFDTADWNWNEEEQRWEGGRPPGSSFKIYTLIAELREGISFDSHWKTSPFHPDWMEGDDEVHNAGRTASTCEGRAPDYCTLRWATQYSYNVPFAYFSEAVSGTQGPQVIMQAAMDAGIKRLKDTSDGTVHNLAEVENAADYFYHPIAYGQYPVSVLEHASGVATLAAEGVHHEPHFVAKVEKRNKDTGEWEDIAGDRIAGEQRVTQQQAAAITGVLTGVPDAMWQGQGLADGRKVAAKTGTWEAEEGGNADAWVIGYTPQLATAVWVGDPESNKAIKNQFGQDLGSSDLPAFIFQQFMSEAHAAAEFPPQEFPQAPDIGNSQHPYANGEQGRDRRGDDDDRRCRGLECLLPGGDDEEDGEDGGDGGGDLGGDLGGEEGREEDGPVIGLPVEP